MTILEKPRLCCDGVFYGAFEKTNAKTASFQVENWRLRRVECIAGFPTPLCHFIIWLLILVSQELHRCKQRKGLHEKSPQIKINIVSYQRQTQNLCYKLIKATVFA